MDLNSSFLAEATRCLFSSLQADVSLLAFYRHVQRHIPLREFNLNKTFVPYVQTLRIGWVDDTGFHPIWDMPPMDEEECRTGPLLGASLPTPTIEPHMVKDTDDELFQYFLRYRHHRLTPPFFFLPLRRAGQKTGAAVFQCTRTLNTDEQELLRTLEPLLCLAMHDLLQFKDLAELKEDLVEDNARLRRRLEELQHKEIVGEYGGLREVMKRVRLIAPIDIPVLITGERGTGKKFIANVIHGLSRRNSQPLVHIRCGSKLINLVRGDLPLESLGRANRFAQADSSSLLLEDVDEISLDAQSILLHAMDSREVYRTGSIIPSKINVRLMTTTTEDLVSLARRGEFREDLYYRLRGVTIHMPALRERIEDLVDLVGYYIRKIVAKHNVPSPVIPQYEMDKLRAYSWPGNIRELQQVLEEAILCANGKPLHFYMPDSSGNREKDAATLPNMESVMRDYVIRSLKACGGRIEGTHGAARIAGVSPGTFRNRCKKMGIEPREYSSILS